MSRLPVAAFVALVVATVGAFFVTQHLKVATPLIAGYPAPVPAAINPVSGGVCGIRDHQGQLVPTSFRRTTVSFYLLNRADNVNVYILNSAGTIVRTLPGSGVHLGVKRRHAFIWNGREDNGSLAPDGTYTIQVSLVHQGRSVPIANNAGALPVTVESRAPQIRVTGVTAPGGATPAMIPQPGHGSAVTVHFTGNDGKRPRVLIYRTDLPGAPRLVKSYAATSVTGHTTWDGTVRGGAPAPQGTYLVGLMLTDRACTTVRFPVQLPPAPGSSARAGVTVRYLAAQPPMVATPAGALATVGVDARGHAYTWKLYRAGLARLLASGTASGFSLAVRLPAASGAGLYGLALRWGSHRTVVPLVAGAPAGAGGAAGGGSAAAPARAPVLVVLPALTWQGENPSDDDGDGLPNVLTGSEPVRLVRPLVDGLPAGAGDEAALLNAVRAAGLRYDVTTDLALIEGLGPKLAGHAGVVLAGSERWLPGSLGSALSTYVEQGGHVLSLGIDSMLRGVTVSGAQALDPTGPRATDALLARPGPVASTHGALILVAKDGLGIFTGTAQALRGYRSYQPITAVAAPASIASAAGVSTGQPAIVGYRLGRGIVVDIGLPGFAGSLAGSFDARQLLARIWAVVSRR